MAYQMLLQLAPIDESMDIYRLVNTLFASRMHSLKLTKTSNENRDLLEKQRRELRQRNLNIEMWVRHCKAWWFRLPRVYQPTQPN